MDRWYVVPGVTPRVSNVGFFGGTISYFEDNIEDIVRKCGKRDRRIDKNEELNGGKMGGVVTPGNGVCCSGFRASAGRSRTMGV